MAYIYFTEEQKERANTVDLKDFLERQGERLLRSGPEWRMANDHSITIRGNRWYDHASDGKGGAAISFVILSGSGEYASGRGAGRDLPAEQKAGGSAEGTLYPASRQ